MMKSMCLLVALFLIASVQSYAVLPVLIDGQEGFLRLKRSPDGGRLDVGGSYGPGRTGQIDTRYTHEVWRGRNGQSLELNGGYTGQFGHGMRPNHNFGIGGTFRF